MSSGHELGSSGNVILNVFGFSLGIKVLACVDEQKLSEVLVHAACGNRPTVEQRCPHCRRTQAMPVRGGSAPRPTKTTHCTHAACRQEIIDGLVELSVCETCGVDLKADDLKLAHGYKSADVLLSEEQRTAIDRLRTARGIHVKRVLGRDQVSVSLLMFRRSYQLTPDKGFAEHFEGVRRNMEANGWMMEAAVVLRNEISTLNLAFEHMGLISLDRQGDMLLTMLYEERDVSRASVPRVHVADDLLAAMHDHLKKRHNAFDKKPVTFETPAVAALWGCLEATVNGKDYVIPARESQRLDAASPVHELQMRYDKLAKGSGRQTKTSGRNKKAAS